VIAGKLAFLLVLLGRVSDLGVFLDLDHEYPLEDFQEEVGIEGGPLGVLALFPRELDGVKVAVGGFDPSIDLFGVLLLEQLAGKPAFGS
jgi:hypothetical protein